MYPVLKDGVSIGFFIAEGSDAKHYYIENDKGEEFELSHGLYNALLKADGRQPLNLPNNGKDILPILKENGLVQTSRFIKGEKMINRFILFRVNARNRVINRACRLLNSLLPIISFTIFIVAAFFMLNRERHIGYGFSLWLYFTGVALSVCLHEIGHIIAGIAYGYKLEDVGVILFGVFPIGGYVAHEEKCRLKKWSRIQFSLAGVEMNLLMSGIFLSSSIFFARHASTLACLANVNVIMAAFNLLPTLGLDGESALSALLEVKSIYMLSKKWIRIRKNRRKLLSAGLHGWICFMFFISVLFSRIAIWIYMGLSFIIALGCFIIIAI